MGYSPRDRGPGGGELEREDQANRHLHGAHRGEGGTRVQASSSAESSSSSDSSSSGGLSLQKRKGFERLDEERGQGFVVAYNRIDRGKLHRGGGCWMAKQGKFKRAKVYEELPMPEE